MTIPTGSVFRSDHQGNGSATSFPYGFRIYNKTDIKVLVDNSLKTLDSDYTVTGVNSITGGTIEFATAPASGVSIALLLSIGYDQLVDYKELQKFPAETHEQALDKGVSLCIQLQEQIDRAVKAPQGETANLELPLTAQRANKYFAFDSNGAPMAVNAASASGTSVTSASGNTARLLSVRADDIFNVLDFGAVGNGTTDDTAAIQSCINAAGLNGTVFFPDGVYRVSPQTHVALPGTFGDNSVCLKPLSGQRWYGRGVLALLGGTGGSSGAVVGNYDGAQMVNNHFEVRIDGNKAAGIGLMSGIVIFNGLRCLIENSWVKDCSFNGIQFTGASVECRAINSDVSGITGIGIQYAYPDTGIILGNNISNCGDNGIDIEADTGLNGANCIVAHNTLDNVLNGIFVESVKDVQIFGNRVISCNANGVYLNQITTPASRCLVQGNYLSKGTGTGTGGIYVNNNSGNSLITGNYIDGFREGVHLNIAIGVVIKDNYFDNITNQLFRVNATSNYLIRSYIKENFYRSAKASGKPFTASPLDNPDKVPGRDFNSTVEPAHFLETNIKAGSLAAEYIEATENTQQNVAWSNAYAIYDGTKTLVKLTTDGYANRVLLINGTQYRSQGGSGGGTHITDINNADGDFTGTVNGNYAVTVYYSDWQDT